MDLSSKTKTVLRSLLISSRTSMTINELDSDFLKYEGHRIPFHTLGFPNLKEYLSSIPDILTISYFDEIIPVTANTRSEHIYKFVSGSECNEYDRVNFKYGYQRPTPRIKIDYLPRNNFNQRREKLNLKMGQLQLTPLQEASGFIKENEEPEKTNEEPEKTNKEPEKTNEEPEKTNLVEQPEITEKKVISGTDEKEVEELEEIKEVALTTNDDVDERDKQVADDTHEAVPFLDEDDPIFSIGLPAVSVKIPNATLTELKSGRTYNVLVTEIERPWRFWFCLCDKKSEDQMEEQLMWQYNGEKPAMKASEMVPGNACLVSHENKVLRAEFMEAPINDKIKVCYVDYGTTDTVGITECRQINKYSASIPKRCFPGVLDLIEPIESNDKELQIGIIQRFCKMVRNKPLAGFVTNVDDENEVVGMILIDTSDEQKDVIVNQKLLAVCYSF